MTFRIFIQLQLSICGLPNVQRRFPFVRATHPLEMFLDAARSGGFDAREQAAIVEQSDWGKRKPRSAAFCRRCRRRRLHAKPIRVGDSKRGPSPPCPYPHAAEPARCVVYARRSHRRFLRGSRALRAGASPGEGSRSSARFSVSERDSPSQSRARTTRSSDSGCSGRRAERSLRSTEQNLAYVTTRHSAGAATELDLERARANVERARQDGTQAELLRTVSGRNLETLSGVTPTPVSEYPIDDLRPEVPLNTWLASRDTPSDCLQAHLNRAAASAKKAAAYSFLPTLGATAQEHVSNATGFSGMK